MSETTIMGYTKEHIIERLRGSKPLLQRKYPISEIGVFGSYARGDNKETSDIVLLVGRIAKTNTVHTAHVVSTLNQESYTKNATQKTQQS